MTSWTLAMQIAHSIQFVCMWCVLYVFVVVVVVLFVCVCVRVHACVSLNSF